MFCRTQKREFTTFITYEDVENDYERELIKFKSGPNQLQGYLYGKQNTKGLVVVSHGIGSGAEDYIPETLYFVDNGYQVFSFDNTGSHLSEGESLVGLSQSVIDLDAALSYIESEPRFDDLPIFLYGHSWGGYAVTAIFNYDHDIAASVSVAGFNKPMDTVLEWAKGKMGNFAYVEYPYIYIYQKLLFGKNANMSAVNGINNTDTPILIIHGEKDTTVVYNGSGTIAYRDEITNPNVQYKVCSNDRQNDHDGLYMSLDAIKYLDEVNMKYNELKDRYNGNIPKEAESNFYADIDKHKASELDSLFMQDVILFYENSEKYQDIF